MTGLIVTKLDGTRQGRRGGGAGATLRPADACHRRRREASTTCGRSRPRRSRGRCSASRRGLASGSPTQCWQERAMSRNMVETMLGAAVLAVAIGFLAWAYGRSNVGDPGGYTLRAKFDRVDGLDSGADVRISGIKVGKVLAEKLDPQTYPRQGARSACATASSCRPTARPRSSAASLLGGKYLGAGAGRRRADAEGRRRDHADPVLGQPRGPDRPLHLQRPDGGGKAARPGADGSRQAGAHRSGWAACCAVARQRLPQAHADGPVLANLVGGAAGAGQDHRPDERSCRLPIGTEVRLRHAADHRPGLPDDAADRAARERRLPGDQRWRDPGEPQDRLFTGWMFSSSPALSALEHPVYDVWLLECAEPLEPEPRSGRRHRPRARTDQADGQIASGSRRDAGPAQPAVIVGAADLDRAEARQMRRHELGVEQPEAAGRSRATRWTSATLLASRDAAEHALAEERRAERDAVEPADQLAVVPALDAVRLAARVQRGVEARSISLVDPGGRAGPASARRSPGSPPRRRCRRASRKAPRRIACRRRRGTWNSSSGRMPAPLRIDPEHAPDRRRSSAIGKMPAA